MNRLKAIGITVLAAVLCLTVTGGIYAGGKHKCGYDSAKTEKYIGKQLKKLTKKLDLSATQRADIEKILSDKMERKRELNRDFHKDVSALYSQAQNKIRGVLNSKQQEKYEKWSQKKRGKKKGKGHKGCEKCKSRN